MNHRKDPFFNVNPLRPRLNSIDIKEKEVYSTLAAGMKIVMSGKKRASVGMPDT
jgi:hypothetical protein